MSSFFHSSVTEPFDPSSLKTEVKNATVGLLVDMLKNDVIDLNPEFQRSRDLWNASKKSQLIESILMGLPLPSFYFYIDETRKKWVVIDGLQRLCSFKSFLVDKILRLQGLDFLDKERYGRFFDEFDYFDQLAITMHPVTLNILSGDPSAKARYIIFKRVNSSGTQLTSTEMRNALYQGPATALIKRMVGNNTFIELVSSQIGTDRMKDKEFVSRFLLFYLKSYNEYDGHLDTAICEILDYINKELPSDIQEKVYSAFDKSLEICKFLLGKNAFRKPENEKGVHRKNAVSLTIFEMLSVTIARMDDSDLQILRRKKNEFVALYEKVFLDKELQRYIAGGTSKIPAIRYRFKKIDDVMVRITKAQ